MRLVRRAVPQRTHYQAPVCLRLYRDERSYGSYCLSGRAPSLRQYSRLDSCEGCYTWQRRLAIRCQVYRGGRAQVELVRGILYEDPDLIYKTRSQIGGLYGLRRELRNGRNESDPSLEASIREAVDRDRRGPSRMQLAEVGLGNIRADPFRIGYGQRKYRFLRRCHLAGFHQARTDNRVDGSYELRIRKLLT